MADRLLSNAKVAVELDRRRAQIAEKADVEIAEIIAALGQFAFGRKKAANTEKLRALELSVKCKAMFTVRQLDEDNIEFTLVDVFAIVSRAAEQCRAGR